MTRFREYILRTTVLIATLVWITSLVPGCAKPPVPEVPQKDVSKRVDALWEGANAKIRGGNSVSFELGKSRELLESLPDEPRVIALTSYLLSAEARVQFHGGKADKATAMLEEAVELLDDARTKFPEPTDKLRESGTIVYTDAALLAARSGNGDRCMELFSRVDPGVLDLRTMTFSTFLEAVRDRDDFKELVAKVEQPLLDFDPSFQMHDHKGKTVSLGDFVGKVVVINIWGTWCPPCRREMPHFIKMQEKHADELQFVGLTYEQGAPAEVVTRILNEFVASNSINYPLLVGQKSYAEKVPKLKSFPTTFIVDRQGKLRKRVDGGLEMDELEMVLNPVLEE